MSGDQEDKGFGLDLPTVGCEGDHWNTPSSFKREKYIIFRKDV